MVPGLNGGGETFKSNSPHQSHKLTQPKIWTETAVEVKKWNECFRMRVNAQPWCTTVHCDEVHAMMNQIIGKQRHVHSKEAASIMDSLDIDPEDGVNISDFADIMRAFYQRS
eukprot:COSAG05_NODE_7477_length_806_cov_0.765205_2_plen_112_part_00